MDPRPDPTSDRKRDHLELAVSEASQSGASAGWDDVELIPRSLPGVSPADVDLTTPFVGRTLSAPLVLVGMTGGHREATGLNAVLGEAAEHLGIAVGVGSQRAALGRPDLVASFASVRERAPKAIVLANLGACQLVAQGDDAPLGRDAVERAVEMVAADALAVHLNAVQELVQPEGDRELAHLLDGVAAAVDWSPVPVVAKETGAGLDRESAAELALAGVAALDVGGAGGTSFARIEADRAAHSGDPDRAALGRVFADWGIPTASSVLEVRGTGLPVVATGGIRSGLDAARALALGATLVGVGRPAMLAAQRGTPALVGYLERLLDELRTALVLCGAATPAGLADRGVVLSGATQGWATQRGLV